MEQARPIATKFRLKSIPTLFKETFAEWTNDKAARLGAALAYYTVFSIAPLFLIAILIAGLVFDNAQTQIISEIKNLVGEQGAMAIESMIKAAQKPMQSLVATILALVTLLFGAAGVFVQLKDALNTVWNVPATKAGGFWPLIRKYFLSFTMVLGVGFLLLVSLLLDAGLAVFGRFLAHHFAGLAVVTQVLGYALSFGLVTLLFAMIFKFLPDAEVAWKDVEIGALLTAGLFIVGKFALGIYLGKAGVASAYGAAGSLVLVLLWVYYSSQILLFGAEFTQVYARHHGSLCERDQKAQESRKEKLLAEIERERTMAEKKMRAYGLILPVSPRGKDIAKPRFKT